MNPFLFLFVVAVIILIFEVLSPSIQVKKNPSVAWKETRGKLWLLIRGAVFLFVLVIVAVTAILILEFVGGMYSSVLDTLEKPFASLSLLDVIRLFFNSGLGVLLIVVSSCAAWSLLKWASNPPSTG